MIYHQCSLISIDYPLTFLFPSPLLPFPNLTLLASICTPPLPFPLISLYLPVASPLLLLLHVPPFSPIPTTSFSFLFLPFSPLLQASFCLFHTLLPSFLALSQSTCYSLRCLFVSIQPSSLLGRMFHTPLPPPHFFFGIVLVHTIL